MVTMFQYIVVYVLQAYTTTINHLPNSMFCCRVRACPHGNTATTGARGGANSTPRMLSQGDDCVMVHCTYEWTRVV